MARKRHKTPAQQYSNFALSSADTQRCYADYLNRMTDLYLNLYKFENIPDSIDTRYLCKLKMKYAACAFFKDEIMGVLALPFNVIGRPDVNENPQEIEVYAVNGYHRHLRKGEFAIMWSNYRRYVPYVTITIFAERMVQTQRTIDVNLHNQKTPRIVKVTDNSRMSVINLLKDVDGYVPGIEVNEAMNTDNLKVLDLNAPYVTDKMDVHKNVVWNEFLTWCGVENSNMDKKERLVANEVMGNYGNVEMGRNTGLDAAKQGLKEANALFGLNMDVSFNSRIPTMLNAPEYLNLNGGKKNGDLYDNPAGISGGPE